MFIKLSNEYVTYLTTVNGLNSLDEEQAVSIYIFHEDQKQLKGGLDYEAELGGDERV